MRYLALFSITLFLLACGESESDGSANGNETDRSVASPAADAGAPDAVTITVTYITRNAQSQELIAGAEVCIDGRDCVITDEEGQATVEFSAGESFSGSIRAEGFMSVRGSATLGADIEENFNFPAPLIPEGVVALLASKAGLETIDREKGHILFLANNEGADTGARAGVSATLEPAGSEIGPKYVKEGEILELILDDPYDDSLEATTTSGFINFYNVTPGDYTLRLTGTEGCYPFLGRGQDAESVQFDVKANELSYVTVICPVE